MWACVLAAIGCGPSVEVYLFQPNLPQWQRNIHIQSEQAYWTSEAGALRVLVEFPLPGATTGKPTYLLYLRLADSYREQGDANQQQQNVHGFLIQTQGKYWGLASVMGGKVTVKGKSQASNATRRLTIDLHCEDETQITGRLRARRNDWHMKQFETRRRPADVRALTNQPPTTPARDTE
ncbi:MAG: hypothetical protein ACYTF1_03595 [Planctomycetota bacterium]